MYWDLILTTAEYSYNNSSGEETGMTQFELDIGWKRRIPLDMVTAGDKDDTVDENLNGILDIKSRLEGIFKYSLIAQDFSKSKQVAYRTGKYNSHQYAVDDLLLVDIVLFIDDISKAQKSSKLGAKRFGSYPVANKMGKNSVLIDLPKGSRVHPVVHIEHTVRYKQQSEELHYKRDISLPIQTDKGV